MTKKEETSEKRGKHRPQQLPISKAPVPVLRQVVAPARPRALDPRFDRAFGHYNPDLCSKSYSFIKDIQQDERRQLKEAMKGEADPNRKQAMQRLLDRQASMEAMQHRDAGRKAVIKEWKAQESGKIAQGKRPYHLKKKEIDAMVLERKLEGLKAKGVNLERIVEKKRKKRAAKQHTRLPFKTPEQLCE
jgi:ribosomal RNA-processing protein 36